MQQIQVPSHLTVSVDDRITLILSVSMKSAQLADTVAFHPASVLWQLSNPFQCLPLLGNRFNILSFMKSKVSSQDAAAALHEMSRID